MSRNDLTPEPVVSGSRFRVRYSLRTVLIVVTVAMVALAYVADRRRLGAIEAWDRALRNVICANIAAIPVGTSAVESSMPAATSSLQESQFEELREAGLLTDGSGPNAGSATSWSPAITLDVSQELDQHSPIMVANRLLRHYETGLADHGLTRIASEPGTCNPAASEPSAVWISNRDDANAVVIIDVDVQHATSRGNVRIRHIARPLERL